ncbi:MAG: sugar ABC transporter permease [Chloroflexota bacterium]
MKLGRSRQSRLAPYLFLSPNLIIFIVFIIIPAIYSFWLSLFKTSPFKPPEYAGLDNYIYLATKDDLFRRALSNMAVFVVGDVGLILIFSVGIGLLLNQQIRWRGFFRSAFFYPVLLSPVVVALVWQWILNNQFGVLNAALLSLGFPRVPWLLKANWAMFWVITVHGWATVGFFALIVLAGLQSIPPVLYEAAEVDGAGRVQRFWHITLPMLLPTLMVVLILSLIRAFEIFDHIFVLTGGGPGFATLAMVQYIYRAGFELDQLGLATAASVVLFVIILSLTALQYLMGRLREAI